MSRICLQLEGIEFWSGILVTDKDNATYGVSGMRSVARTFPGPSVSMDRAHAGGVSAGQAAVMALQVWNFEIL